MIDETTYKLPTDNYLEIENTKKQIVIGHTYNHDMRHVIGWLHRYNGKYQKTAAFTIDSAGFVYKHFEPKYQSKFFTDNKLNKKTIVILLDNDGWLTNNNETNEFKTWNGDIYNKPNEVLATKWRGYEHWATYSKEQIESLEILIKQLSEEFSIPLIAINNNTKISNLDTFSGIIYKSNLDKNNTDLSPAWDCMSFKEKIETK